MNSRLALLVAAMLMMSFTLKAEPTFGEPFQFKFASAEEGKQLLTTRDDFVERMSRFDRAARLKTDTDVSLEQYLSFVGENVVEWSDAEQQKINAAIDGVQPRLDALNLSLPDEVLLVKTTGREEGGAAYTRGHAIVLPQANLRAAPADLQQKICHELFHVLSRTNPELREKLYAAIGFAKCDELEFPSALASRKITNPDAPKNDHCIRVQVGGEQQWAIPILFSRTEKYNLARGGEFFHYLEFQLLLVEPPQEGQPVQPLGGGQNPKLVSVQKVSGFFDQVGNNTKYIIHPEEILADNFALLVMGERKLRSPEVVEKLEEILKAGDGAEASEES